MIHADPSLQQNSHASAQIAQALGETATLPRAQIARIVQSCGPERALAWAGEAQATAAAGAIATSDGARARTLGGVFFRIVRDALRANGATEQFNHIFRHHHRHASNSHPSERKPKPGQTATPKPPATWAERGAGIAASAPAGKVTKLKVTLIGRPGKIVAKPDFTLLQMKHSGNLPAVPKGIPLPTHVPETTYVVYIGAKQWRGVAEAIKQPDDVLIIEGSQFYDKEFEAIAVFATNTTTRALQQAKRVAQAEHP